MEQVSREELVKGICEEMGFIYLKDKKSFTKIELYKLYTFLKFRKGLNIDETKEILY